MNRRRLRTTLGIVLGVLLTAGACSSDREPNGDGARQRPDSGAFEVRLSAGQPAASSTEQEASIEEGNALDAEAVAAIVDRLPPFAGDDGDRVPFNRPPQPLPLPRVGRTIDQPLGASDQPRPPAAASGALEVLRRQPEGAVDVAPFISVTFNQPMVPLGTLEALDDADVPVRVTPELEGRWRWIGTRTLRFEHDPDALDRLPMATDYTVEVPAGTRSQRGSTLDEAVRWTFRTPPPQVRSFEPAGDSSTSTRCSSPPSTSTSAPRRCCAR